MAAASAGIVSNWNTVQGKSPAVFSSFKIDLIQIKALVFYVLKIKKKNLRFKVVAKYYRDFLYTLHPVSPMIISYLNIAV